jgi:hypothetical protein
VKPLPLNDETRALARRLVWFDLPEKALADPVRFLAYAFARATHKEMKVLRAYVDEADLREALGNARQASSTRARGPIGICAWDAIPRRLCRGGDWDEGGPEAR